MSANLPRPDAGAVPGGQVQNDETDPYRRDDQQEEANDDDARKTLEVLEHDRRTREHVDRPGPAQIPAHRRYGSGTLPTSHQDGVGESQYD